MAESSSSSGLMPADRRQLAVFGGVGLVLLLVLSLLWYVVLRTEYVPAFSQLKPDDAALIVAELDKKKIPYKLSDGGSTILVAVEQVDAARVDILGGGLPLKGTVGFELFNKSDMGLTEFAQKINYQRALQGELARTLMSLENVEDARVHVSLPEDGVFRDEVRPAKASVTLTPRLGATIGDRAIVGIQRLVASAVEGLDAGNVVVLDAAGRQLSGETPEIGNFAPPVGLDPLEQRFAQQVRTALSPLLRDDSMRILVAAPPGAQEVPGGPRSFALQITVLLSRNPEAGLRERAIPLLESAFEFGRVPGDSFELVAEPGVSPFRVGQPIATTRGVEAPAQPVEAGFSFIEAGLAALVIAILALVGVMSWRSRRRNLSEDERSEFAERLRELLAERGADAPA